MFSERGRERRVLKHYSKTEVQDMEDMENSLIDYSKEVKYK